MRRYPLVLLCLLACQPVLAISFQTRLEKVEWQVEGDQFECRLSQPITDFGSGVFVRRAGEQVTFRMQARERWLGAGSATLLAAAAPWQPGRGDINLGTVSVGSSEVLFNSSQEQGARLLTGGAAVRQFGPLTDDLAEIDAMQWDALTEGVEGGEDRACLLQHLAHEPGEVVRRGITVEAAERRIHGIAADIARSHGGALRLGQSEALGGLRAELTLAR
mgnify:CR=1 FL=1